MPKSVVQIHIFCDIDFKTNIKRCLQLNNTGKKTGMKLI